MQESRTISIRIARPAHEVYEYTVTLENRPAWASGLGTSGAREGQDWMSETAQGPVRVRFVERNHLGVLDHHVTLPDGGVVYSPMRVVPNDEGSEIAFTLFRRPGMTDEQFQADAAIVERDLKVLQRLLES